MDNNRNYFSQALSNHEDFWKNDTLMCILTNTFQDVHCNHFHNFTLLSITKAKTDKSFAFPKNQQKMVKILLQFPIANFNTGKTYSFFFFPFPFLPRSDADDNRTVKRFLLSLISNAQTSAWGIFADEDNEYCEGEEGLVVRGDCDESVLRVPSNPAVL